MVSPCQTPLPLEEYTTSRVVVYYYRGRWIPIMFYPLLDAIALYRQALLQGQEVYVFPSGTHPRDLKALVN